MKKLLFASVALLFTLVLSAQVKFDDHLKFKTEVHDFGKIKINVPVTYDFVVSNVGKTPVVIETAVAGCGCTTPIKPEQPIMAGKNDKLTAGFNAAAPGPFTKTITVKLAGIDETKTITIKGEVLENAAYEEYVKTKDKDKTTKSKPN